MTVGELIDALLPLDRSLEVVHTDECWIFKLGPPVQIEVFETVDDPGDYSQKSPFMWNSGRTPISHQVVHLGELF